MENETGRFDKKLIVGLILMALGGLLIFDNFFNLNLRYIILSWPMILIIVGAVSMANTKVLTPGIVIMAIGVFFLLPRFGIFGFDYNVRDLFLPLIFIGLGVIFITTRGHNKDMKKNFGFKYKSTIDEGFIDDTNIFGGGNKVITSQNFKGGSITSIFGGSEYNFVNADITEGRAEIEVTSIFGGSKYVIPADWKVVTDVSAIFGGFSDKRVGSSVDSNSTKVLYLKGVVIFGGGEIVSY